MALDPKDYRKEYSIFEFVSEQYENGMLIDDERIRFYKARASMYKQMFESNGSGDRRETYRRKWIGAEKGLKDMFGITFKL